jgi:hypothetical protein
MNRYTHIQIRFFIDPMASYSKYPKIVRESPNVACEIYHGHAGIIHSVYHILFNSHVPYVLITWLAMALAFTIIFTTAGLSNPTMSRKLWLSTWTTANSTKQRVWHTPFSNFQNLTPKVVCIKIMAWYVNLKPTLPCYFSSWLVL